MKTDYDDEDFIFADKTLVAISNGILAAAILAVLIAFMVMSW